MQIGNNGTTVYLSINFNKDGKEKFKNITEKYIKTTDEEGNETTKEVEIKIDDEKLLTTHFEATNTEGILQLSVGSASTDSTTINSYIEQASNVASVIMDKKIDIQYDLNNNLYIPSSVNEQALQNIIIGVCVIIAIALIYICIKYKVIGILASFAYIGAIAVLLLVLRYTNVYIAQEGLIGVVVILITNYAFLNHILNKLVTNTELTNVEIMNKAFIHYIWVLLPLLLISIIFTFVRWIPISSMGMVMFWGIVVIFIYNYLVTRTLLKN